MKKTRVFPSVFGRLFGDNDAATSGTSLRTYRDEVLRDLGWLLNTSCHPSRSVVHRYPRVAASTLNYGMHDFTGMNDAALDPEIIADAVRDCIERFEPRIAADTLSVRVRGGNTEHDGDSFLVEIAGDLWALPASEPLSLKTRWDVVGGAWVFD